MKSNSLRVAYRPSCGRRGEEPKRQSASFPQRSPAACMHASFAWCSTISGFFFFIFKKFKISKIYVGFGKFQKYTPVALWRATGLKCNFFFFKFATKSLEKKKEGGLSPPQRATGPCRPPQGRQASGPARGPVAPPAGDRGGLSPPPPRATGSGRLYKASPSFPSLIWPQKIQKNPEKREGWEEGKRRSSAEFRTCDLPVTFV